MGILNVLKKQKAGAPIEKQLTDKDKQPIGQKEVAAPLVGAGKTPRLIRYPRITEKSKNLNRNRQYIFDVLSEANKTEVKKAIEAIYRVKVAQVRIINIPAKKRRLGRTTGKKAGYKKAVVTLQKGYQLETTPQ